MKRLGVYLVWAAAFVAAGSQIDRDHSLLVNAGLLLVAGVAFAGALRTVRSVR